MTALITGPNRKRRTSGNSQFINRIGVCENHSRYCVADTGPKRSTLQCSLFEFTNCGYIAACCRGCLHISVSSTFLPEQGGPPLHSNRYSEAKVGPINPNRIRPPITATWTTQGDRIAPRTIGKIRNASTSDHGEGCEFAPTRSVCSSGRLAVGMRLSAPARLTKTSGPSHFLPTDEI